MLTAVLYEVCVHDQPPASHKENLCLFLTPRFVSSAQARAECGAEDHRRKHHSGHRSKSRIVELPLNALEVRRFQRRRQGQTQGARSQSSNTKFHLCRTARLVETSTNIADDSESSTNQRRHVGCA